MFVHRPATRSVWFVPWIAWLAGGAALALGASAVWAATRTPARPDLLLVALAGAILCGGLGLCQLRFVDGRAGTLRVRSAFRTRRLPRGDVAIGFRVRGSIHTVRTELYATTGDETVVLGAGRLTAPRAQRQAEQLAATLQTGAGTPHAQRRCAVDAAPALQAHAAIDGFYRGPKWRRSGRVLLAIVLIYLLLMLPVLWWGATHTLP